MPSSLTLASPANASSAACCAFQPKRPTRVSPAAASTTPGGPRCAKLQARVLMIVASGIARSA